MASREQIFGILAAASSSVSRAYLEEKTGQSYRGFQTQLDRWVKQGLIEDTGDHHYLLTDAGREISLEVEFANIPADEITEQLKGAMEINQATVGTTEYQQFLRLGYQIGVTPLNLIKVTTDHVWNGGSYEDLKWVAEALQQMGIQRDLANRWFSAWRSHLKKPLPMDLPQEFLSPEERKVEVKGREGKGLRNYILNADNRPVRVSDGQGDLDYEDAVDLSKIREARSKGEGQPATPGSMADEVTKIFTAFKAMMGDGAKGKSYIVKPGPEGYTVEEVDTDKPLIIPQGEGTPPSPSYLVDNEGKTTELKPGQPVVIIKEAPKTAPSGTQYLVDQKTGQMTEIVAGQPIIIKQEAPPASTATPIQLKDKEGNPIILDLNTFIRLEEHKEKQRRDDETHEVKLEIAKGFRNLLKKAETAMSHMGEEE